MFYIFFHFPLKAIVSTGCGVMRPPSLLPCHILLSFWTMIINEGMIINEDTWMIKTKGWSYLWTKGWWWSRTKDNHHRGQKFNNKQNHLCEQRDDDDKQKDNGHCGQKIDNKQNDAKQKDDREQEDGDHYGKKNYHDQAEDHYKTWKRLVDRRSWTKEWTWLWLWARRWSLTWCWWWRCAFQRKNKLDDDYEQKMTFDMKKWIVMMAFE